MSKKFHFISGLPRSGSTLLSSILIQNPRFHASISSPVLSICNSIISDVSAKGKLAGLVSTAQRQSLIRGVFDAYYEHLDHEVVFDTNRLWTSRLRLANGTFKKAKIIACVRNVSWVLDSLERRYHANPYEYTSLFDNHEQRSSIYARVDAMTKGNGKVGAPWLGLREAFYGEHSDLLLILDYDYLTQAPEQAMRQIYDFIDEPYYQHRFDDVGFDTPEFDSSLGLPGLHLVRSKVERVKRPTILPPDLFSKYSNWSFWQDHTNTQARCLLSDNAIAPQGTIDIRGSAVVAPGERGPTLLCGASGVGKSTLSALLCSSGWTLLTDRRYRLDTNLAKYETAGENSSHITPKSNTRHQIGDDANTLETANKQENSLQATPHSTWSNQWPERVIVLHRPADCEHFDWGQCTGKVAISTVRPYVDQIDGNKVSANTNLSTLLDTTLASIPVYVLFISADTTSRIVSEEIARFVAARVARHEASSVLA